MQIKTALAVYNRAWCIEPQAGLAMLSVWEATRAVTAGAVQEQQEQQSASYAIMQALQARADGRVKAAPTSIYSLQDFNFEGAEVAVITLQGVMLKEDVCGYAGTATVAALLRDADRTESVKSIILQIDSPGGAVSSISVLQSALKACNKTVTAMVVGQCASASYFAASCCSGGIYATDKYCEFGSIGTMCKWSDGTKAMEKAGVKVHEYYATASTEKNADVREANAGKPKKLVEQYLDPRNDIFLEAVREGRAGKLPKDETEVLAGQVFLASEAQVKGLIDGMASAEDIIANSLSQSSSKTPKTKMSITRFGAVMVAIAAASLPVVEGGFLLSEPQLDALDARLTAQGAPTENPFAAQLTEALKATGELATANTRIAQLEAELATAKTEIVALGKLPGADFKTVQAEGDPVKPEADALDTASFAHNLAAAAFQG